MNAYSKAALMAYGTTCLVFMGIPVMVLAATQPKRNAIPMLLWVCGVFAFVLAATLVVGSLNERMRRKSWVVVHAESVFVLLAAAIGGALPVLWSESSHEFITMGAWIIVYGIFPAIMAGIFHYGYIERVIENRKPNGASRATD